MIEVTLRLDGSGQPAGEYVYPITTVDLLLYIVRGDLMVEGIHNYTDDSGSSPPRHTSNG